MTPGSDADGNDGDLELRRVVAALVDRCDRLEALVERLSAENAALKAENQDLQDEIARLKGLPPRPKFKAKPSGMEQSTQPGPVKGKKPAKRRRGAVKSKLEVSREVRLRAHAPAGSRFQGL